MAAAGAAPSPVVTWIAVAAIAAAAGGYWLGSTLQHRADAEQFRAAQAAEHRAGPWANVTATVDLAPGQTLRMVQIRTGILDDGSLDPRCLIYSDATTHSSAISCPGVQAVDLAPPD